MLTPMNYKVKQPDGADQSAAVPAPRTSPLVISRTLDRERHCDATVHVKVDFSCSGLAPGSILTAALPQALQLPNPAIAARAFSWEIARAMSGGAWCAVEEPRGPTDNVLSRPAILRTKRLSAPAAPFVPGLNLDRERQMTAFGAELAAKNSAAFGQIGADTAAAFASPRLLSRPVRAVGQALATSSPFTEPFTSASHGRPDAAPPCSGSAAVASACLHTPRLQHRSVAACPLSSQFGAAGLQQSASCSQPMAPAREQSPACPVLSSGVPALLPVQPGNSRHASAGRRRFLV